MPAIRQPFCRESRLARATDVTVALGFFLVNVVERLPDPYWLFYLLAFLPLLPVARLVNQLNAQLCPLADPNTRFSAANIVWAAVGGLILLAAVAGTIWVEPDHSTALG
jgi:hypothetical protein